MQPDAGVWPRLNAIITICCLQCVTDTSLAAGSALQDMEIDEDLQQAMAMSMEVRCLSMVPTHHYTYLCSIAFSQLQHKSVCHLGPP